MNSVLRLTSLYKLVYVAKFNCLTNIQKCSIFNKLREVIFHKLILIKKPEKDLWFFNITYLFKFQFGYPIQQHDWLEFDKNH